MLSREIYGTNKEAMLLPINGHINDLGWKLPSKFDLLILGHWTWEFIESVEITSIAKQRKMVQWEVNMNLIDLKAILE